MKQLVFAWSTTHKKYSRRLRYELLLGKMSTLTINRTFTPRKAYVDFELWLGAESWISTTLSSPKFFSNHSNREFFKISRNSFVPTFKPAAMKCKFMTFPSLAVAPNAIREAGFFVWNTGGTSEGSYVIHLSVHSKLFLVHKRKNFSSTLMLDEWQKLRTSLGSNSFGLSLLGDDGVFEHSHIKFPVNNSRHCGKGKYCFFSTLMLDEWQKLWKSLGSNSFGLRC